MMLPSLRLLPHVKRLHYPIVILASILGLSSPASAQVLTLSLFERYLDVLREQAFIPGLSAAVIQNGTVVWERGFGRQAQDSPQPPTPDTPFPIAGLTQTLSAALLLEKCVDESHLEVTDSVQRWVPDHPEAGVTVGHLLTHAAATTSRFQFDPDRFAVLTDVIESCASTDYRRLLTTALFERFAMQSAVPGAALAAPTPDEHELFTPDELAGFADAVRRMAAPHRLDRSRSRSVRSNVSLPVMSAATGAIASLRDLERFDLALRAGDIISPALLQASWTPATVGGVTVPTGLGWFVQTYQGERLVWQFGLIRDGYSSLVLKLPQRDLTLILLANADGLVRPFAPETGDITPNLFAQAFLRLVKP